METPNTEALSNFLAEQKLSNVRDVDISMMNLRSHLRPAGRSVVEPFHVTYHAVTSNISDRLDLQRNLDVQQFKEPEVLNRATSTFYPLYTENLIKPNIHWSWIDDERTAKVDNATLGILGYLSHIGGDLSLTVHALQQNDAFTPSQLRNYLRYDYSLKIDRVLWRTAHQMSPVLSDIQNQPARRALTNVFMVGVVLGRQIALADSRTLAKSRSEDHAREIVEKSRLQTNKLAKKILATSVDVNAWLSQPENKTADLTLPERHRQRSKVSLQLAALVNLGLQRAA